MCDRMRTRSSALLRTAYDGQVHFSSSRRRSVQKSGFMHIHRSLARKAKIATSFTIFFADGECANYSDATKQENRMPKSPIDIYIFLFMSIDENHTSMLLKCNLNFLSWSVSHTLWLLTKRRFNQPVFIYLHD